MPTKITTDQPQFKRRSLHALVGSSFATLVEAPYFSIPSLDNDASVADPDDADRELRAGEIFIASAIQIANTTGTARTVDVEIVAEDSTTVSLAAGLTVPGNDVLLLQPGLSLFKRDLANPTNAGDILRVKADQAGALTLTVTVVEREAIDHSPDTEVI